jgi:hypothetical protein
MRRRKVVPLGCVRVSVVQRHWLCVLLYMFVWIVSSVAGSSMTSVLGPFKLLLMEVRCQMRSRLLISSPVLSIFGLSWPVSTHKVILTGRHLVPFPRIFQILISWVSWIPHWLWLLHLIVLATIIEIFFWLLHGQGHRWSDSIHDFLFLLVLYLSKFLRNFSVVTAFLHRVSIHYIKDVSRFAVPISITPCHLSTGLS